ncbi:MAG: DUF6377 domain-containing protein [Muribaculaceae bacterium]|nr:DUF6377 domain-containing protein [Muribaculaceae bacterium]
MLESDDYNEDLMRQVGPYLKELDLALKNEATYRKAKDKRMETLREIIKASGSDLEKVFSCEVKLFDEYRGYCYDSMFVSGNRCRMIGVKMGSKDKIAKGEIMQARAFLVGGYFKECDNIISKIDTSKCSVPTKIDYLKISFDMNYEDGFYVPLKVFAEDPYLIEMERLLDELELYIKDENDDILLNCKAQIAFHKRDSEEAILYFGKGLKQSKKGTLEYSEFISGVGYNTLAKGFIVPAMDYMTQSAIISIKDGSRSYHSMRKIAECMYIIGNINKSYQYIQIAMKNAQDFNSRYRLYEASKLLPKVDKELYMVIKETNDKKTIAIISLIVLLVLLMICSYYVVVQNRKLAKQKIIISEQNEELKTNNTTIENTNEALCEANLIKDKILGRMIKETALRNELFEKVQKDISRKIKVRNYEDIPAAIELARKENKSTLESFDAMILQLFPDFAIQFNKLLKPECAIISDAENVLTPELRIFALIRLGITKNDDIAKCLYYSVNTIKSYKTKVINVSLVDKEQFYEELSNIKFNRFGNIG